MQRNIRDRVALLELRVATLESHIASTGADLIGVQPTGSTQNTNDFNPVNPQRTGNSPDSDRVGAFPVRRNGKVYWRMPAGAPLDTLTPNGQWQRLSDTARKARLPKIVTK